MNSAAVTVALGAAVAFGWSTALMYHSASRAPRQNSSLAALIGYLVRQPRWLLGMVASLAGLGLHALALRLGSLAVVQPLVVTGLVFAFLFRAVLDRRWPSRALVGWVVLTAAGIALFLFGARSVSGADKPSGRAATIFLIVGIAVVVLTWTAAGRASPRRAGVLLGVAGGMVFGLIAGVLKAVTAATGLVALFSTWPVYVLLGLGAAGFVINQHAYSSAPLSSSLPVLDVVNPVVAVIFGVLVFDERPSRQPLMVLCEAVGLVVVLVGVAFLAGVQEHADEPADAVLDRC